MKSRTSTKTASADHSTTLLQAITELEDLAVQMRSDGLDQEAASLQTTVRDLHWQYEDLRDNEQVAPDGQRRAHGTPLQLVR